jgi:hypothetical protein
MEVLKPLFMCSSPGISEGKRLCAHVRAVWLHWTGTWNLLRCELASDCMQCDVSLNAEVSCRYEHILMRNMLTFVFIAFRASVDFSVTACFRQVVFNSRIELAYTSETTVLPSTVKVMKVGV